MEDTNTDSTITPEPQPDVVHEAPYLCPECGCVMGHCNSAALQLMCYGRCLRYFAAHDFADSRENHARFMRLLRQLSYEHNNALVNIGTMVSNDARDVLQDSPRLILQIKAMIATALRAYHAGEDIPVKGSAAASKAQKEAATTLL